jgi:hypothetical protein
MKEIILEKKLISYVNPCITKSVYISNSEDKIYKLIIMKMFDDIYKVILKIFSYNSFLEKSDSRIVKTSSFEHLQQKVQEVLKVKLILDENKKGKIK